MPFYRNGRANTGGGSLKPTQSKTQRSLYQAQPVQVLPDDGYDLTSVTVLPQQHSTTYTPAENLSNNNLGATNNYRYVNTTGLIMI